MKVTQDAINSLDALIQAAITGGITKLIIESDKIRGIDDKQSVVIITDKNVPNFNGKTLATNRIDKLNARINLVKLQGNLDIEACEAPNGQDISILELKGGKTTAQFRCAATEVVKGVPKNFADTLVWRVKVDAKLLSTLNQAVSAMAAESIMVASRDGKVVSFECVDANKDVFAMECDEPAEYFGAASPAPTSFCQKYPAKTFISLVKEIVKTQQAEILIGEGGILSLNVNGFTFFIIPTT